MPSGPIEFAESPPATLGVEWEFALVDKHSRDLVNAASELFENVFGKEKTSVRMVLGVASLPFGMPVELEVILEVSD